MKITTKIVSNAVLATSVVASSLAIAQSPQGVDINAEKRFIVKFKASTKGFKSGKDGISSVESLDNALQAVTSGMDVKVLQKVPEFGVVALRLNKDQHQLMKLNPSIESIEIDPKRYLYAESTPYGITMVQANQLSDAGTINQKVCVVDTGYMLNHPDLPSSGVTGDDGYGSVDSGNWYNDGNGHGTHVAGTIAAIGGNGQGVVGVNPSGRLGLHIVKVFNDAGNWAYGSDLIQAISQCRAAGSTVISMSLGGGGSSSAEQSAFDQAYAAGVLSIAAAGNDGNSSISYPASYSSVMSVAAVDSSGNRASFSQYNSQVEIAAPGVGVNSTYNNGGYSALSGTSMATPHVSGVAALIWGNNPQCSASQIREAMNQSALDKGTPGRDSQYGYGIVQAKAASDYLQNSCGTPPEDLPPNASFSHTASKLTVSFSDTSTDDKGVQSRAWSFGDGTSSSQTNPNHTYAAAGTYQVTLTVTDTIGQTDSTSKSVTVSDDIIIGDCEVAWSATTSYRAGDKVNYDGYDYESTWWSTGARPDIYSNVWRRLDQCQGTGNGQNLPPQSAFNYQASKLQVAFNNSATDDKGVTSYQWSFGDGNSSSQANPNHSYSTAGTYTVSLTVYDAEGLSDTATQQLTVEDDVQTGCNGVNAWSATLSYSVGDKVAYNGKLYEATWWSTGASPEIFSNVWQYQGQCQ